MRLPPSIRRDSLPLCHLTRPGLVLFIELGVFLPLSLNENDIASGGMQRILGALYYEDEACLAARWLTRPEWRNIALFARIPVICSISHLRPPSLFRGRWEGAREGVKVEAEPAKPLRPLATCDQRGGFVARKEL